MQTHLEQLKLQKRPGSEKAATYGLLGDKEQAFKELEGSYEAKDFFLIFMKVEPAYDDLRSDPRFQDLLRRMKLDS